ncbi:response regulator [Neptunicella sp. SCSIO 80796]|uniref:response regulator n=1 Tax=Neptunicella plasticusilytica TaxID=3117012 RepID=UPI003A4DD760
MAPRKILLIEDNADDELLTLEALSELAIQHQVQVVRHGVNIVEHIISKSDNNQADSARTNSTTLPCLILLDLSLPYLSGIKVLQNIRADKRTCLIPVVMLTSSREEKDRINSFTYGANSYVCKPIEYQHYIDAIKQIGLYWLTINLPVTDRIH